MFSLVPVEYVDHLEPRLHPELQRAAEQSFGRYTADDIFDLVRAGQWQLWVAFDKDVFKPDLAFVTTIVQYPRTRALQVIACAGSRFFKHFPDVDATLRQYARDQGCTIFETYGRQGWGKVLKRYGDAYSSSMIEGFI